MNPLAILTAATLFTGTLSWTNNSTPYLATNGDEILLSSSNIYLTFTNSGTIKNANGVVVTTATNSGVYSLLYQGWGYQQTVSVPSPATNLSAYAPGSLSCQFVTNTQARTNGFATPSTAEQIFSTQNWGTETFITNSAFWLSFAPQKTAIVVGHGTPPSGSVGASAISPMHLLNCTHTLYANGDTVFFVGTDGAILSRTIVDSITIGGSDIGILLLSSALPGTIHPFSLLPSNYAAYMTLQHPEIQYIGCNQTLQLFPVAGTYFENGSISFNVGAGWISSAWGYTVIGGDSGHPIMGLIGTNLVLVGHWTGPTYGPNYASYEPQINAAMHYLSTNYNVGSDYQITTQDLSAWPTY